MIKQLLGSIVSPIAGLLSKREERKLVKETLKGKLANAKQSGDLQIELTDAEWEKIAASGLGESWKDEYVTISVVAILNMIVIGALLQAFGLPAGALILSGVQETATVLSAMGVDLGLLLNAVVFAAIGLKLWRA